jgi:hypothetical protein
MQRPTINYNRSWRRDTQGKEAQGKEVKPKKNKAKAIQREKRKKSAAKR